MTVTLLSDCLLISSANTSQQKRAVNLRQSVLIFCSRAFGLRRCRHFVIVSRKYKKQKILKLKVLKNIVLNNDNSNTVI